MGFIFLSGDFHLQSYTYVNVVFGKGPISSPPPPYLPTSLFQFFIDNLEKRPVSIPICGFFSSWGAKAKPRLSPRFLVLKS